MTLEQLKEKARDNNLRRCILRTLVLESDFTKPGSKFEQLVSGFRDIAPLYAKYGSKKQMRYYTVRVAGRRVRFCVNMLDSFTPDVWQHSQDFLVLDAEGLFSIDHNLSLSLGDGPLLQLIQSLTHVASNFLDFANDSARVVGIASFIVRSVRMLFSKTFDVMEAVLLMIEGLARVTDLTKVVELAQTLAGHLSNVHNWLCNKLVAQAGPDIDPIASLATVFCVIFGSSILKVVPKGSQIDEAVAGSIKFGNLMRGLSSSWTVIEKVANYVFAKIFEWQYGVPPHIAKLEECMLGITDWYKKVQALVSLHTPDEIGRDSAKCAEVETLYSQGVRFSAMIGDFKFDKNIVIGFQTHFRVIQACYDRAQSSGAFRGGPRVEPIVVLIHGQSGVGKSGMMFPLAIDLLRIDGIPNGDFTQQIYNRNIEQEFWDGYRGQRVVIYDDFGQMRDSQANPNLEYFELIRCGNLAPMALHMATIEEKAKTFFKSRVVILTSNTARFAPESLTWPDAVRRRIDISVEVTVKREYAKYCEASHVWRVDPVKVFKKLGVHQSMDVYNIWECDIHTGHHLATLPMSYEKFQEKCEQIYRVRFERSSKLFSFLQERADAPNYEDLTAQLYVPELQETGKVVMRDCVKAFKDFALLDFAMLCDFGIEQCADLFDCPTRLWLTTSVDAVRRNRVTIKDGYVLFLELCEQASYRKDVVEHVTWKLDHTDDKDPLSFLELDPEQRFPCMIHFIQDRKVVQNSKVRQLQTILKRSVETSQSSLRSVLDKAQSALKAAKWYHFALAAIPFVAILWYVYQSPKKNHALSRIDSMKQMTSEDVSHLMSGPVVELGSSADPKTANIKKTVVELGSSADPKTMNVRKATVEFDADSLETEFMLNENGQCCVCGSGTDPVIMLHGLKKLACAICFGKMMKTAPPGTLASLLFAAETELSTSGDPKTIKPAKTVVESFPVKDRRLQAQLQLDPNAFAISKKVLNNIYEFQLEIEGKWSAKMKLCMIRGRVGLTVAHLRPYLALASRVRLYNKNVPDGHIFPIDKINWEVVLDAAQRPKDQLLVCFPSDLHDHADLTGSIADSVTMSSFGRCSAVLCVPFDGGALMKYGEIKAFDQNVISYFDGDRELTIRDRYEYTSLETTRGDCGSILIAIGSHLPKKILGIHVAGNVGLGVASPLAVKDIMRTMNSFPIQAHISLDVDMYLEKQAAFDEIKKPEGNFVSVGVSKIQVSSPSKTALRPSKCHGSIIEPLTAPAALKPIFVEGKLIDPMYNGLKKAGQIPPSLNDEYLDAAINDVMRIVCSNIRESDCRILSNIEAVTGVEGDDCLPPIKRSSSAGYPWIADRKGIGKTKWLGSDTYVLSPDVEFVMCERERLAKQGVRYPTFWIDTLKDERRPIDKVAIGKTRVFSAGPMDFTLSFRKYFLGFAAHCTRNRIDNEISVGTNVYSQDWTKTAKKCTTKGSKVIAGDFSNFDGTLLLPILYRILDIVNEFYDDGEENALVRHVLWKEIINSVHVCGDNVYMWTHSQPSGCPITAILNSIFNSVSMRYCWMVVFQDEPGMRSMKMFNKHVSMVSYGDDNVINISDDICERFNQLTIADAYATLGMVYTDEGKSGEMVKYRDIENVAYLKRKFVWSEDEMIWLAPLAMDTVLEMTNWIRGDLNQEASTNENLETSAFELSIHGKNVFELWLPKYIKASRAFSERPKFLTFSEYRHSEAVKYGRMNE